MTTFKATFFGVPQVSVGQQRLNNLITGRPLALLAYLLITGKPQDRGLLADLL
jgi:hypothetical protein